MRTPGTGGWPGTQARPAPDGPPVSSRPESPPAPSPAPRPRAALEASTLSRLARLPIAATVGGAAAGAIGAAGAGSSVVAPELWPGGGAAGVALAGVGTGAGVPPASSTGTATAWRLVVRAAASSGRKLSGGASRSSSITPWALATGAGPTGTWRVGRTWRSRSITPWVVADDDEVVGRLAAPAGPRTCVFSFGLSRYTPLFSRRPESSLMPFKWYRVPPRRQPGTSEFLVAPM
jgi:hypothetical protein